MNEKKLTGLQRKRIFVESFLVIVAFGFGGLIGFPRSLSWIIQQGQSLDRCLKTDDVLAGVSYSELEESLLSRYDASSLLETRDDIKLMDAMDAMKYVEEDGIPIPIKNYPYLFVGGAGAAYNLDGLLRANISHIINASPSIRLKFPEHFEYMHVNTIHDESSSNIAPYFNSTSNFIEKARLKGGKVLVHCRRGWSRSVTILIAYLMKYHYMRPKEALHLIRTTRSEAHPNRGFLMQLDQYENFLEKKRKQSRGKEKR